MGRGSRGIPKTSYPPHVGTSGGGRHRSNTVFSAISRIDESPAGFHGPDTTILPTASQELSTSQSQENRDENVANVEVKPIRNYGKSKDHRGWVKLSKKLAKHDKETIKGCNSDIDTLLVFAGLFSAVLTAFVIELYKSLQPDPEVTSAQTLQRISQQLDSFRFTAPYINSTQPPSPSPPFQPSGAALRINTLWFTSLVISLVVASLGMFVKQWLRQYMVNTCTSAEERVRVRHLRYEGLLRWGVFEICAALPLLLQLALVLFFIGLSDFLRSLSSVMGWFVTALIAVWLSVFVAGTMAPVFFPSCPYSTPFLDPLTRSARRRLWRLRSAGVPEASGRYYTFPGDELATRRNEHLDLPALIQADRVFRDDAVVTKILSNCMHGFDGHQIVDFIRHMLSHRLHDNPLQTLIAKIGAETLIEFRKLHTRAVSNSVKLLLPALHSAVVAYREDKEKMKVYGEQWFREGLSYIFAVFEHCAEKKRQIGFHATHGQIIDLHSFMLSGEDDQATRLWMSLRLQYPMVPFELETLALSPQAINKVVAIVTELSVSQESVQDHIILLQVMLEIAYALVNKYIGKVAPPELDLPTANFREFMEKALVKLKRLSFSQVCASVVTSRLIRIVDKLEDTITSHSTPALHKLQPMLRDVRNIITNSACISQSICSDSDSEMAVHTPDIPESMQDVAAPLLHTTHTRHITSSSRTISASIDETNIFGNESVSSSPKPDNISLIASASESHSIIYHTPKSERSTLPDSPITDLDSIVVESPSEPSSPTSFDLTLPSETGLLSPDNLLPLLESSSILAGTSEELNEVT